VSVEYGSFTVPHPIIWINDLQEVISNLEYLIKASSDQAKTDEYNTALDTFKKRLLTMLTQDPDPDLRIN
jgi:hypothetical protein